MAVDPSEPTKPDYPTLSRAFSLTAQRYQGRARWVVGLALSFLALAALLSVFRRQTGSVSTFGYHINVVTGVASALFLLAAGIRLYRILRQPERLWYGSRALAERTKSLAWRYMVGGLPFPLANDDAVKTDAAFNKKLDEAAAEGSDSGIPYRRKPDQQRITYITPAMHAIRASSRDARRALYADKRIANQQHFYERREAENSLYAALAQWLLVLIEVAGAVLALLTALNVIDLDLVGVTGTVAAGVVAWAQFNQYNALATTYRTMMYRMTGYYEQSVMAERTWSEDEWAVFVDEVEKTLGLENGAWQQIVQRGSSGGA
jgi:hypothetical protein